MRAIARRLPLSCHAWPGAGLSPLFLTERAVACHPSLDRRTETRTFFVTRKCASGPLLTRQSAAIAREGAVKRGGDRRSCRFHSMVSSVFPDSPSEFRFFGAHAPSRPLGLPLARRARTLNNRVELSFLADHGPRELGTRGEFTRVRHPHHATTQPSRPTSREFLTPTSPVLR